MDEYKNTAAPVGAGEKTTSIPPARGSLVNTLKAGAAGLQTELMKAPPIHRAFLGSTKTGMEADMILASQAEQQLIGHANRRPVKVKEVFARGDRVYDSEKDSWATITRAAVARTKKGTLVHVLVDNHGDAWRQLETKLSRRKGQ